MRARITWFAIKAEVRNLAATIFDFPAQKTMYGGRTVAVGDPIFLFASENAGGAGLFARGVVASASAVPRTTARRQTPRVSIRIERTGTSRHRFGRAEARGFRGQDERPEAEIDFKLYRQATDKIVGLSDMTGAFLADLFQP